MAGPVGGRQGRMTSLPPPRSALNLRLLLASISLLICAPLAVLAFFADLPVLGVVLTLLAVVAVVDLLVVQRRRRRRTAAERRSGEAGRHGLFE